MALLQMGRLSEAEKAVRTALLVRPQGKDYHLGLGMVLRGEGKLSEAQQEIGAELAGDPQNPEARTLLNEVAREMEAQAGRSSAEQVPKSRPIIIK